MDETNKQKKQQKNQTLHKEDVPMLRTVRFVTLNSKKEFRIV